MDLPGLRGHKEKVIDNTIQGLSRDQVTEIKEIV